MTSVKEAQLGIEQGQKDQLVQKLNSVYCEKEALENQIRACQWNTQGNRASELCQMLTAIMPETEGNQRQSKQRIQQTIQPFTPTNEIAERISMFGERIPSTYQDMSEYSKIENPPKSFDVHQNAEHIAKACEQFSQTTREAIKYARQAQDEGTAQALTDQLRPAEQLATQLRRFQ
jgi:DNA-binding ferritin-like protein